MQRIAIIGLGLMGGSLGKALRARRLAASVAAYARRPETRRAALAQGVADEVFARPEDAVRGADLAVFCTPVLSIPDLVRACVPGFARGTLVTDVGSTKRELVAAMEDAAAGSGARAVGSHPIAGSEQAGMDAARADLYEGAVVVVTPTPRTDPGALRELERFWQALGARTVRMDPAEHDRLIARTSHLPHLIAALTAATAGRDVPPGLCDLCGPGLRDTTRVADGPPEMWHDIFHSNREALAAELGEFSRRLADVKAMLDEGRLRDLQEFLNAARRIRAALYRNGNNGDAP